MMLAAPGVAPRPASAHGARSCHRRLSAARVALGLASLLGGCSHLPTGAPTAREFEHPDPSAQQPPYLLITLDPAVAAAMAREPQPGLAALFGLQGYRPHLALRAGDMVSVTIFEVSPVALLGASPAATAPGASGALDAPAVGGHMATIPPQVIELDGTITIPFGGPVRIGGLTPKQAGVQIARALAGKATDPQVVVSLVSTLLDAATVGGDVQRPGVFPLTVRAERVLDIVAAAGGAKFPSFDSDVQLVRGGRVARVNLQHLVDEPTDNVTVRPGDGIFLTHNPRTFSVLGSALKVSQYDFNLEHVSLAEAIARSGGVNDQVADVGDIYLLRFESPALVNAVLPPDDPRRQSPALQSPASSSAAQRPSPAQVPPRIPVAYHLDLRRGGGYFVAQTVQMRDKDVILVTDADAVQLQKLLGLLRGFTGVYFDLKRATP